MPYWDQSEAITHIREDIDRFDSEGSTIRSGTLWESREEYMVYPKNTFREHVAQVRRYQRQIPGWQTKRNKESQKEVDLEMKRYKEEWDQIMSNS